MNKEGAERELEQLRSEAGFKNGLKKVFEMPEGQALLEFILTLGNFGGIIRGDYDCGRYAVASQVWIEAIKASPEAVKKTIDKMHHEYINDRQLQFKQAETQLKEVDDE